jgi:hypothetical protein
MTAITIPGLGTTTPARITVLRDVPRPGHGSRPRPVQSVYRRRRIAAVAVVIVGVVLLFLGARLAGGWALGVLGGGPLTASGAGSSATASVQPPVADSSPSHAQVHLRMQPVSQATYVVAAGDTLWSIARRLQPTGDVRPLVDALAASRHGLPLQPGEPIVMPTLPGS